QLESGGDKIDLTTSIKHCCREQNFLQEQLRIVSPSVVVALGDWALKGLGVPGSITKLMVKSQSSPEGYVRRNCEGLPLNIVPVRHPMWHIPKDWTIDQYHEKQTEHYRYIWKALSHILRLAGADLVAACFPK